MIFKTRKIPKHLILQEEYQFRQKARPGLARHALYALLVICLSYILIVVQHL